MRSESTKCDECNIEKKETNHWFKGYLLIIEGQICGAFILPFDINPNQVFAPNMFSANQQPADLCGQQHVVSWLSKNLQK